MTFVTQDLSTFGQSSAYTQGVVAAVESVVQKEVSGALPALSCVMREDDLEDFGHLARHLAGFEHLVLLGTGGSSLGAKSLLELVRPPLGYKGKSFHFVENVDPHTLASLRAYPQPSKTGYLVISKSGTTAETLAQFLCVLDALRLSVGDGHVRDHVLVITQNDDTPLRALANKYDIPVCDHPKDIGGRFSVFSCVGMIPALLMGVDVSGVRNGARSVLERLRVEKATHAAATGAAACVALAQEGKGVHVMMPYSDRLAVFSKWWVQLWAESLGKEGQGTFPVAALGTVDQHSQLQLFLEGAPLGAYTLLLTNPQGRGDAFNVADLSLDPRLSYFSSRTVGDLLAAEQEATLMCLRSAKRPVRTLCMDDVTPQTLGALMMHAFLEVILAAELMGIDAFSQPAVEEGKILTRQFMQEGYAA
ncbi:MAG: glucose-6-phosphate isomerase [Proteobacteria bacterium]|nr:glucose-6-phosphate isomerase [Pseudomonadota bacterium]